MNHQLFQLVSSRRLRCVAATLLAGIPLCLAASPASAETRGYIISWFATATHVQDFKLNCPQDRNGGGLNLAIRNLMDVGYSREDATKLANDPVAEYQSDIQEKITNRAVVNGKHVSVYNYPDAVKDPNIETVTGKYAYGFDLGGPAANKFEDPDTHQKIDNQLWRAIGCLDSFHSAPPLMPYPEELSWNVMTDSAPAWAVQITGDDLSKDGPVTITIDRALEHLERDASGGIKSDATYVIDPSQRSHNVLQGQITHGVLTVQPKDVYLEAEMPYYFDIDLKRAHMRFSSQADGKLVAYWGGFIHWKDFAYMYTARPANGADSIGIYHALKKMADADPDPATGQNRTISTTYRMEAVPAFLAHQDGKIVATASPLPLGGMQTQLASAASPAAKTAPNTP
jgi:hypothetical protein